MATDQKEVEAFLDGMGLSHASHKPDEIGLMVETEHYTNDKGNKSLLLMIRLLENGEYVQVFCPSAYKASGEHADAVLRLCMMIQWSTKLIQFEFDATDGEIRPTIEFPLEDARLTARQLKRCMSGMISLTEDYHEAFERVLKTGEIKLPGSGGGAGNSQMMLQIALNAMVAEGRSDSDPQVRALRAMLAGGAGAPSSM